MNGDFSRDSFNPAKHFTRVLMQQGRVQIDADWNEQISIFWQFWRSFVTDSVGPHAGPEKDCGFYIAALGDLQKLQVTSEERRRLQSILGRQGDFLISPGRYYLDGILCSNGEYLLYSNQRGNPEPLVTNGPPYLIYLDVWERHITHFEDDSIREVALNGADTCTRAKAVWQVRAEPLEGELPPDIDRRFVEEQWTKIVNNWQPGNRGHLKARAKETQEDTAPNIVSPESRYRGPENQLYRVQIHNGGTVVGDSAKNGPTFKWSRDNASNTYGVVLVEGAVVTLDNVGRDAGSGLRPGDWVEIVDDKYGWQNQVDPPPLLQVEKVDRGRSQITLKTQSSYPFDKHSHPVLVRWDQKAGDPRKGDTELYHGAALIREEAGDRFWLTLEDGVQIQFENSDPPNTYRTGDYWLIPARTATGDVEWPQKHGKPHAISPHGIEHHYAPLAIVKFEGNVFSNQADCRYQFKWHRTHADLPHS